MLIGMKMTDWTLDAMDCTETPEGHLDVGMPSEYTKGGDTWATPWSMQGFDDLQLSCGLTTTTHVWVRAIIAGYMGGLY